MSTDKFDLVLARADRVMQAIDERDGAVRSAAQRERARLNAGLGRTLKRVAIGVGLVCAAAIALGLVIPLGMFGFLAAVGLAIAVAAVLIFSGTREIAAPNVAPDLPNGEMVQRSARYIFRAAPPLPAPPGRDDLCRIAFSRQKRLRVDQTTSDSHDARLLIRPIARLIDLYLVPTAIARNITRR